MVKWQLVFSKQATKDAKKLGRAGLKQKTEQLLDLLEDNPFSAPPKYEKLVGNLEGFYSRRINIQHRLIYEVIKEKQIVRVLQMWTHYE